MTDNLDDEQWLRIIRMIRRGDPLPKPTRVWIAELLDLIRCGEDPRELAGKKSKRGRPRDPRAIIGMHYWGLRAKYGRGGEAAARAEVAKAWKLSQSRVKTIGANTRFAFKESMTRVECLNTVIESIAREAPRPSLRLVVK